VSEENYEVRALDCLLHGDTKGFAINTLKDQQGGQAMRCNNCGEMGARSRCDKCGSAIHKRCGRIEKGKLVCGYCTVKNVSRP